MYRIGALMLIISGTVNVLALTGSFYMLQVYDRVLSSRSIPTLVALSVLAAGLYLVQGCLEVIRAQLLVRIGSRVERRLTRQAHEATMQLPLMGRNLSEAQQPIRDLDTIRSFLSGQGPVAMLDMPWMPLYVIFAFLLHPMLGWLTLFGAAVLIGVTFTTELMSRRPTENLVKTTVRRQTLAAATARNAEVLRAMGFGPQATRRYAEASIDHSMAQERLGDLTTSLSAASRVFRLLLQSAMLGLGAYLTIRGDLSAGSIIASSIATSRAYAPIEIAIANWKGFTASRQAARRLKEVFARLGKDDEPLDLPAPVSGLKVENVSLAIPGSQRLVLNNIGFELEAGTALAVIGPSAAGKSSLARAIVGVWRTTRGTVRIDGAAIEQWAPERLGRHIGYLPQDVELFDGSIKDNIARFDVEPDSRAIIAAATAAGVHDMILRLPDGYETSIGEHGAALSAGQRQRIGLARALYGEPFLVVLDEPNSNLDADGEEALAKAIQSVRQRKGIAIVIAHRPGVLAVVDKLAVLGNGQLTAFGPRDDVLRKAVRPVQIAAQAQSGPGMPGTAAVVEGA